MPNPVRFFSRSLIPVCLVLLLLLPAPLTLARSWWQIRVKNISIDAEIVRTDPEQRMGLGNRFSLPEGQGMLFVYPQPGNRVFWMKRMNFPIDIIWFQHHKAVKIEENIPYPAKGTADEYLKRYGQGVLADMVLELPAGFVKRNRLAIGDRLQILKTD